MPDLRTDLLAWYAEARRDLPWRRTRDPYAIWLSEAMLQQTRVETVIPYWTRFLERFPTVEALAAAEDEALLAAWSGLGYYRRVRSLREAARVLVRDHGGRFPADPAVARTLPGVGPYTAGAVCSIAYGTPAALVDGNVERVFARLFELDEAAASPALKRAAWAHAEALVPDEGAGDWNQALMELGALVCTPREPRCLVCPVRAHCGAHARGRTAELPRPRPRAAPVDVRLEVLLVERGGRVLLARRPAGGRMAGMLECPTREVGSAHLWPEAHPPGLDAGEPLFELGHGITRHRVRAEVRAGTSRGRVRAPLGWFAPEDLPGIGLTGLTRKLLRRTHLADALSSTPGTA